MATWNPTDEGAGDNESAGLLRSFELMEIDDEMPSIAIKHRKGHTQSLPNIEVHEAYQPESSSNPLSLPNVRIKEACSKLRELFQGLKLGANMRQYVTAQEVLECLQMLHHYSSVDHLDSLKILYDHSIKMKNSNDLQQYCKRLIHKLETQIKPKKNHSMLKLLGIFMNRKDYAKKMVNLLWSIENDSHHPVAKVNGVNITVTDIRSLSGRRWLSSNIVDVYLLLITVKKKGISVLPCSKVSSIISGICDIAKLDNSGTILSICLKDSHFSLLIMDMEEHIIRWLDPASEEKEDSDNILNMVKLVVTNPDEWTIEPMKHTLQNDNYNCGVYCLLFAEKYLANVEMTVMEGELEPFRYKVATKIMKYPVPLLNNLKKSEIGNLQVFNAFPQLRKCVPKRKSNTRANSHIPRHRKGLPILRARRRRRLILATRKMTMWARTRESHISSASRQDITPVKEQ